MPILGRICFSVATFLSRRSAIAAMHETRLLDGGFTNATRGFDTVLCLDTSGSMAGRGIVELKRACLALIDAARESPVPENIALVAFGGSARLLAPLTNDYSTLSNIVNSITAEGGTPMKDGLVLAYTELIVRVARKEGVLRRRMCEAEEQATEGG